ncbi:Asp/Glu/hydantoin racemase [Stachybotrys elegans]|uniref:Asp/Glu/hydantoin racemase n=1 Tax=Stachybotrys elegans TaxID=80388 RepID=A0A8K0WUJ6_9HYPO|nr:Asp/Glu/hydantoin racemase [Stachybotrys elegans]
MAASESGPGAIRILVLNPNSSQAMTQGMESAIKQLSLPDSIKIETYTAPSSSPASIDNAQDILRSTKEVMAHLETKEKNWLLQFDAVLIACYSVHSLVPELQRLAGPSGPAVLGIFEASIMTSLSLLPDFSVEATWGVVTTGKFWEDHLSDGVKAFVGQAPAEPNHRFAGVYSTGLAAGDFHHVSPEQVSQKLRDATKRLLLSGPVGCVVMGCAGMAGLEAIIRSVIDEVYQDKTRKVYIIDGVKAGTMQLEQIVRSRRAFE